MKAIRTLMNMVFLALALAAGDYMLTLVAPTYQSLYEISVLAIIVCVGCVSLAVALAHKHHDGRR